MGIFDSIFGSKKEDKKYEEFKENIKSHLSSGNEASISFYVHKWDTIEQSEMSDNWNGKDYTIYADIFVKNAEFKYEDSLNDFYVCLENANSISDLNANDFNFSPIVSDGESVNIKRIEWEEPLTDEEEQDLKSFGGVNELVTDGFWDCDETVFKTGKIWRLEVTVGDNKYTLERND